MSRSLSIRAQLASASEAEIWAQMCQQDWSLGDCPAPTLIELRGSIVVLYWEAVQKEGVSLDAETLFRGVADQLETEVHGLIAFEGSCLEFYRAVRNGLTLLDQPEEGDLGVVSEFFPEGEGIPANARPEDLLDKFDEQSAQSSILEAVARADREGAF